MACSIYAYSTYISIFSPRKEIACFQTECQLFSSIKRNSRYVRGLNDADHHVPIWDKMEKGVFPKKQGNKTNEVLLKLETYAPLEKTKLRDIGRYIKYAIYICTRAFFAMIMLSRTFSLNPFPPANPPSSFLMFGVTCIGCPLSHTISRWSYYCCLIIALPNIAIIVILRWLFFTSNKTNVECVR